MFLHCSSAWPCRHARRLLIQLIAQQKPQALCDAYDLFGFIGPAPKITLLQTIVMCNWISHTDWHDILAAWSVTLPTTQWQTLLHQQFTLSTYRPSHDPEWRGMRVRYHTSLATEQLIIKGFTWPHSMILDPRLTQEDLIRILGTRWRDMKTWDVGAARLDAIVTQLVFLIGCGLDLHMYVSLPRSCLDFLSLVTNVPNVTPDRKSSPTLYCFFHQNTHICLALAQRHAKVARHLADEAIALPLVLCVIISSYMFG